jgi:hypothetical protein
MLYEAERHEELTTSAWDEQAARACIDGGCRRELPRTRTTDASRNL